MAKKLKPHSELSPRYRKKLIERYEERIFRSMTHRYPTYPTYLPYNSAYSEYYRTGGRFKRYVTPTADARNAFHQVNVYSNSDTDQVDDLNRALEWIQEHTEGKWTVRILADRFSDNGRPVTQFWFEDLSEAAMFRLKF